MVAQCVRPEVCFEFGLRTVIMYGYTVTFHVVDRTDVIYEGQDLLDCSTV
jgi:hypothetical protein